MSPPIVNICIISCYPKFMGHNDLSLNFVCFSCIPYNIICKESLIGDILGVIVHWSCILVNMLSAVSCIFWYLGEYCPFTSNLIDEAVCWTITNMWSYIERLERGWLTHILDGQLLIPIGFDGTSLEFGINSPLGWILCTTPITSYWTILVGNFSCSQIAYGSRSELIRLSIHFSIVIEWVVINLSEIPYISPFIHCPVSVLRRHWNIIIGMVKVRMPRLSVPCDRGPIHHL